MIRRASRGRLIPATVLLVLQHLPLHAVQRAAPSSTPQPALALSAASGLSAGALAPLSSPDLSAPAALPAPQLLAPAAGEALMQVPAGQAAPLGEEALPGANVVLSARESLLPEQPEPAEPAAPLLDGLGRLEAARELGADSAFDGTRPPEGPATPAESATVRYLDAELARARRALRRIKPNARQALAALETLSWARAYLDEGAYDSWAARHSHALEALDGQVAQALANEVRAELAESDFDAARQILDELRTRHAHWASRHEEVLRPLREGLPDDRRSEPAVDGEPGRLAELMHDRLAAGEFRQAEYLLTTLQSRHKEWAAPRADELEGVRVRILEGVYAAFEAKKRGHSPLESRRLREYARALAQGRNLGFGFKQPVKQDPGSLMCTVFSLCNAFEASSGFSDPTMDHAKFTEVVRGLLGDPTVGVKKGLSTHKVRQLMKALGLDLRVVEMQERMKRPFEEEELKSLYRPDQVVIPVLIIAQTYADEPEKGIQREEHKGFLRDAYYSRSEKRWVYLMMDPLVGRTSFYTWPELKALLHKLFIIKVNRPLATPAGGARP